jgi:putative oxidoreductase
MDWIYRIFGNYVPGRAAAGLLIVRFVFGLGIMLHGWQKIQSPGGPAGWMNPPPAAADTHGADSSHGEAKPESKDRGAAKPGEPEKNKEAEKKGARPQVPAFFQGLATVAEFSGGLGLIVGLLTPIASLGVISTMLVALGMVHLPNGHAFVGEFGKPSFELAALYLAAALLLLLAGPGAWSLDAFLFGSVFRPNAEAAKAQ